MAILTQNEISTTLQALRQSFQNEGIVLLGFFGSYARNEATAESDLDILMETTPEFLERHRGLKAYAKLDQLRSQLQEIFHKKIDLIDKQGLLQHHNSYILDKTIYV